MLFTTMLAALVAPIAAAKDGRTFAVLRFHGAGFLTTSRADPIVSPGQTSAHLHSIHGGNQFSLNATGETMRRSTCTTALLKDDLSAYWVPTLFFQSPTNGSFIQVPPFYMNVYYFFEPTNDDVKAFPVGLKMVSGNAMLRTVPELRMTDSSFKAGALNLDPSKGTIQPTHWTCPRPNLDSASTPPSWPAGSDGSMAGIGDPINKAEGMGLPFRNCDGYASPLRMDLHFPSCYNPAAGLENYQHNMAFPTDAGNGKNDCPRGWIHVPHIFFEVYWNTPLFAGEWTNQGQAQPFVLANGDRTGFSAHGDMIAGWNEDALQHIIDTCNAGDVGMDQCPGVRLNDPYGPECKIESPVKEEVDGWLEKLPGSNPPAGWGVGNTKAVVDNSPADDASAPAPALNDLPTSVAPHVAVSASVAVENKVVVSNDPDPEPAIVQAEAPPPTATSPPKTARKPPYTFTTWATTTVYTTVYARPTAPASFPGQSIGNYSHVGCYEDHPSRVLVGEALPNLSKMTNTRCVEHCATRSFALAGTENGGQCYCGNELNGSEKMDDAHCKMACEGDESDVCGGEWALRVYSAGAVQPIVKARRGLANHLQRHQRSGWGRR